MPRLTVAVIEAFQRSEQKKLSDTQQRGLVVRKKAGWPAFYLRTQVSGGDVLFLLGAWRRELEVDDADPHSYSPARKIADALEPLFPAHT